MSLFSSAALFIAASFSSLSPAQQTEIDCLAVLTVASTESNSQAKFGISNMSERVGRLSQAVGARYVSEYGISVDDFTAIFTDRLAGVMMRNSGGSARVANIRPQVEACKTMLPE